MAIDLTPIPPVQNLNPFPIGASVEVRSRFDQHWSHGFTVAVVDSGACQLLRQSDGSVLPAWFALDELRPARSGR